MKTTALLNGPNGTSLQGALQTNSSRDSAKGSAFGTFLSTAVNEANKHQMGAQQAVEEFATGSSRDLHQTMIAMEKADVSFQFLMQVRNKIITAYQEIMRMQI